MFCQKCGSGVDSTLTPPSCTACQTPVYHNPLPVAVALVPIRDASTGEPYGWLGIQRAIPPREGLWALPGGFMEQGESVAQAAAREVEEETGIALPAKGWSLVGDRITPDGKTLLLFIQGPYLTPEQVQEARPGPEARAVTCLAPPYALAFPLHTEVAERAFREIGPLFGEGPASVLTTKPRP